MSYPVIFANHSATAPNARLECWPVPRPGKYDLREHMVLVATRPISLGEEVRFDYEAGGSTYWTHARPAECHGWKRARVSPPPPTAEEPVIDRLLELRAAAALRQLPPPCREPREEEALAWEGPAGGDQRLSTIVPILQRNAGTKSKCSVWAMAATHVPGRTGHECYQRWHALRGESATATNG